ncbi:HD-GYP domain-containing protein [Oceanirhabdus sp. W0125-5]|uniref:HD-GYP domain-containing protein n=1 Tax=Oceanirhabdus sp. W0125-5 TaxID=2999116 RepID=UPI0022F30C58|nr:HD domain-containing phosphohydrolase [Oceanirhabdus sp. W0125-5]WBW97126.1 HD domain-containing protein [Oceanirhabdus sp. W0125-5]
MHQGLFLGQNNKYIENFTQKSSELRLLAKGDGTEIMLQKINSGIFFVISPGENGELMEFFYILEGCIEVHEEDNISILKQGEYFYAHHLRETVKFKAKDDVTLLYVTTQPVFQYLSKTLKELTDIVKDVDKKDSYTYSHDKRVQKYSIKIANKLRLSKERFEHLAVAAQLHDIGKINVPIEILNKPGRLTPEEFECIKKHSSDGRELVKKTYYANIGTIIEQHHERLDGSGYPYGLKGQDILLEAKIIAVADTYDAMTTDRPYRKGLSPETALNELKRLSGIHYDEEVVNVFEEILKEEKIV